MTKSKQNFAFYILGALLLVSLVGGYLFQHMILPPLLQLLSHKTQDTVKNTFQKTDFTNASITNISNTIPANGVGLVVKTNKAEFSLDTESTTQAITGSIKYFNSPPKMSTEAKTDTQTRKTATFIHMESNSDTAEQYALHAPPAFPVGLQLNMGAGSVNLNLYDAHAEYIDANVGAGNVDITFPKESSIHAIIKTGAGDVSMHLPKGLGVQIAFAQGVPANLTIGNQFVKTKDGLRSTNYDTAQYTADITLLQGVGAFHLETIE